MKDWKDKMEDLKSTPAVQRVTCEITGESVSAEDLVVVTYTRNGEEHSQHGLTEAEAEAWIKGNKARDERDGTSYEYVIWRRKNSA